MPVGDLAKVGPRKPLGYMPLQDVEDPPDLKRGLESRGLSVFFLTEPESHIESGALVAYHRKALGRLLKSRRKVLVKNKWPDDPDVFARHHMTHNAPFRTDLFDLVADAYADYDNPFRKGSKVKSVMKPFGLLRHCFSHLL